MRLTRRMLLVAAAAIAALAMSASTASATTAIQVVNEGTNTTCTNLTDWHTKGGCAVHATGTLLVEGWAFTWFTEAICVVEMEMRLGGDGRTAIDDVDLYDGDANCDGIGGARPWTECNLPWEGGGERVSATEVRWTHDICVSLPEVDVCAGKIQPDIVEGANEELSIRFIVDEIGSKCLRLSGTLKVEASSNIHIN